MLRTFLIIAASLGVGILTGYTLLSHRSQEATESVRRDYPPMPVTEPALGQSIDMHTLAGLQQQLQRERQAREQLQVRLEALQFRLEKLEYTPVTETTIIGKTATDNSQTENVEVIRTSVQKLIAAGINETQAIWIQERLDEAELQKLYLRDLASREGWLNKPRYRNELQQYQNTIAELREQVDDDVYDRLLYTQGRANRVVILDTMQNSAAAQYGLRSGDQIFEYDGQRIFSTNELSSLVTQGTAGGMTLVRIKRDGEIHDLYLPRGPLGIRMRTARIVPE